MDSCNCQKTCRTDVQIGSMTSKMSKFLFRELQTLLNQIYFFENNSALVKGYMVQSKKD